MRVAAAKYGAGSARYVLGFLVDGDTDGPRDFWGSIERRREASPTKVRK